MKTGPWKCDTCGRPIKQIKDGYVEWLAKEENNFEGYGLHLVHHKPASPLSGIDGCYYGESREAKTYIGSVALADFVGYEGLINILENIQEGLLERTEAMEMIMRLHLPGYEQGRAHINQPLKK